MVVLPHPGGPHRISDASEPRASIRVSVPSGPSRWSCPTTSSSVRGRSRSASGRAASAAGGGASAANRSRLQEVAESRAQCDPAGADRDRPRALPRPWSASRPKAARRGGAKHQSPLPLREGVGGGVSRTAMSQHLTEILAAARDFLGERHHHQRRAARAALARRGHPAAACCPTRSRSSRPPRRRRGCWRCATPTACRWWRSAPARRWRGT